jgi:hypothetical protein
MPVHDWARVIPGIFHDFHQRWIGAIRDHLNAGLLPPEYYALAEQVAEGSQPDVVALERRVSEEPTGWQASGAGLVAVVDHPPQVKYIESQEREIYARSASRVGVYHASGDRIVGFIEIVSPGNKRLLYELKRFLNKLDEALQRGIHLLVIDVHPPGRHDPRGIHAAFWEMRCSESHGVTAERPLGLSAYRADAAPTAYFEPFAVGDALPDMPVFLTPGHYINVPLEATYLESWRGAPARWKQVLEGQTEPGPTRDPEDQTRSA